MREKKWLVYYINMAELHVELYRAASEKEAEFFASRYDGPQKEIYVKPVWVYALTGRDT